jgi:hypothetical protein
VVPGGASGSPEASLRTSARGLDLAGLAQKALTRAPMMLSGAGRIPANTRQPMKQRLYPAGLLMAVQRRSGDWQRGHLSAWPSWTALRTRFGRDAAGQRPKGRGPAARAGQSARTWAACGPLGPWFTVYSTFWFSASER